METTLLEQEIKETVRSKASQLVYAEFMAQIIKQLPNPGKLKLLTGTSSAQASFYFKSPSTDEINATLYNNLLSQRIEGEGTEYNIEHVGLSQNSFINDYNDIYLKMTYQLSTNDKATLQRLDAETAATIKSLRPIWNNWVEVTKDKKVEKLNMDNTNTALIQMTITLQSIWVNPDFEKELQDDPSFPYTNMNDFDLIFNKIPVSVPKKMRDYIKNIYNAQGKEGGLTAQVANATQTLAGIINNVQNPTIGNSGNGGLKLTGTDKAIPGMTFEPTEALELVGQLGAKPPTHVVSYTAQIKKSETTILTIDASVGAGIKIPILEFFSVGVSGGAKTSIFDKSYAGSNYTVKVVVNNPTISPIMSINPMLYNISTKQGWMSTSPVKEALKNEGKTDVTGYVFTSKPNFNFAEAGDFGYINSLVLSQFLELSITFEQCDSKEVKRYFEQHADVGISFLGIKLGGASESSSYSYSYSDETKSSVTVTLKPNPPGYTPGTSDITQSLCQLVAVGVEYPFA
jgi:hypothetical protein